MPMVISDEILEKIKMSDREARIEFACAVFDRQKLALWPAAQLAGLSRIEMEQELVKRGLPVYRIDEKYLAEEIESLNKWREDR